MRDGWQVPLATLGTPWHHPDMARALKVYCMPAGFYDAVVAAPSQKAALKAWGTTTDLFAAGRAAVVEDEQIRAEALARPGEVIKRSRGDAEAMLGPEPKRAAAGRAGPKPRAVESPAPDRTRLDAAERELAEAERDLARELQEIARARATLDAQEQDTRSESERRLAALRKARDHAQAEFERAGAGRGRPRRPGR